MKNLIIITVIASVLFFSCNTSNNIEGKKSTKLWKNYSSYYNEAYGWIIHRGILIKDSIINSYPCKKGSVHFFDNDSLGSFTLSEDCKIKGNLIPKGSRIEMYSNGNPEFIYYPKTPSVVTVQNYPTTGEKRILDWHVSFYIDGSLSTFRTKENIEIMGIPCMKENEIVLYPNGRLYHCFLAKDFMINGIEYKIDTHLFFDENGEIATYNKPWGYVPDFINKYRREALANRESNPANVKSSN